MSWRNDIREAIAQSDSVGKNGILIKVLKAIVIEGGLNSTLENLAWVMEELEREQSADYSPERKKLLQLSERI